MTKVSSAKKELGLVERRDYVRYLKDSNWGKQRWRIGFGLLFIGTCLVVGYFVFRHQDSAIQIFERAGSIGVIGFVVGISIAIVLLLPTPILKIFAGAIFPLHIAIFINFRPINHFVQSQYFVLLLTCEVHQTDEQKQRTNEVSIQT